MPRPGECTAVVEGVRHLTPEVMEADLRMQEPPALHFDAGQWVSIPFGPKTVRAYTIASTPRRPKLITLCADVAPAGLGSQWFRGLARGRTVRFKGPTGGFVFHRADPRRLLLVAEEIGIVPIRSILTELYETGLGRPTALIYWARDAGWLVYDAEFRSLARRHPAFNYFPAVRETPGVAAASSAGFAGAANLGDARRGPSRPPSMIEAPAGWRGEKGEPVEVVDRLVHSVATLVAYVSGGGDTINAVRALLVAKGLDRKAVRWEKFW